MKLNLGCGFDKRDGWLNVDNFAECEPDRMLNIEDTPWDLPTDGFEHVLLKHVLEHVGKDFAVFAAVMRELYRITAPDGLVEIHVPHFRHDTYWSDPTHVRAFTLLTFQMMSKRQNRIWMERRANYTMLGIVMDVDFEVVGAQQSYDAHWVGKLDRGEISRDEIRQLANERWNVVREQQFTLRAVKGAPA